MSELKIEMQQKTENDYNTLYPKTTSEQVNLMTAKLTNLITPNKDLGALEPYLAIGLNGGYSGTGGHGVNNAKSITFNGVTPKIVYLYDYAGSYCAIFFIGKLSSSYTNFGYITLGESARYMGSCMAKYDNGVLSWYSTVDDDLQFNVYQHSYGWNAICYGN